MHIGIKDKEFVEEYIREQLSKMITVNINHENEKMYNELLDMTVNMSMKGIATNEEVDKGMELINNLNRGLKDGE